MEYSSFWRRLAAYLLDSIVMEVTYMLLVVVAFIVMAVCGVQPYVDGEPNALIVYGVMGGFIVYYWAYRTLFESSHWMGTPGKLVVGIRVTDMEGKRISFSRANARFVGKIVFGFAGLAYVPIFLTKKKQGVQDVIAGTVVVRKNEDSKDSD